MAERLPELRITPGERFETGCIATLTGGGMTFSRHFVGSGREATRAVADYCDENGLRVVTLSTPGSIFRDLQGGRYVALRPHQMMDNPSAERVMLGAIGRVDLDAASRTRDTPDQ